MDDPQQQWHRDAIRFWKDFDYVIERESTTKHGAFCMGMLAAAAGIDGQFPPRSQLLRAARQDCTLFPKVLRLKASGQ